MFRKRNNKREGKRVNKLLDHFNLVSHASLVLGVAAASASIGRIWSMTAAALITGVVSKLSLKHSVDYFENDLQEHPACHLHSPNLGHMVRILYKMSGLKVEGDPVYSFKPKESDEKKPSIKKMLEKGMEKMRSVPNAAAVNISKPVIIISEPLLKLLNDDEEYAVLAHEFVHASAKHSRRSLPLNMLNGIAQLSNNMIRLYTFLGSGLEVVAGATWMGVLARARSKAGAEDSALLELKDQDLNFEDKYKKKKLEKRLAKTTSLAFHGTASVVNPLYLKVYLATMGLNLSAKFASASLSRRNEFQADREAVTLGADPLALATALLKIESIVKESGSQLTIDSADFENGVLSTQWKRLFSSHPQTKLRVRELAKIAKKQGRSEDDIKKSTEGVLNIPHHDLIPEDIMRDMVLQL